MRSVEAFTLVDFVDIVKVKNNVGGNSKDTQPNFDSVTIGMIAALDRGNKNNSFPIPSEELLKYTEIGSATAGDILLSRELGKLGDSGYDATFRPAFLTLEEEEKFNADMNGHSVVRLYSDARTRASLLSSEQVGLNHYMIDQLEASGLSQKLQKQFLLCIIR